LVAKELFTEVNKCYEELYGPYHNSTVNSLINLATVHKDLHEYEECIPLYEKAIEARKVLEGDNSMNYVMAKAMAAGAYRELGKFDIADSYLKDAYIRVAMEFGEDNPSAAVILNSMGLLYKKQGKFERSLDAYQRALTVRETQMGEDHPDSCATRHNIAELYIQWANPSKA
jgi:tetratricopeptide (TPR) repeat protein